MKSLRASFVGSASLSAICSSVIKANFNTNSANSSLVKEVFASRSSPFLVILMGITNLGRIGSSALLALYTFEVL